MWFVTTLEKLELSDKGWPSYGATRTPLFCAKEEDAVESVEGNRCDMWEYLYEYAVIEFIEPDQMYGGFDNYRRRWFRFDRDSGKYFEIDEPDFMKRFINIAIG